MDTFRTKVLPGALSVLLYLITLILGLWDVYLIREIFYIIYAQFSSAGSYTGFLLSGILILILGLTFIVFMFVTAEFHRKHVGQSVSWKLYAQTISIEAIIPILAFFMKVQF